MTTTEIEYALVDKYVLCNKLVATGITKNCGVVSHECDVLVVSSQNYITDFEIKVSVSDVKADLKKKHKHECPNIRATYFVLPKDILDKIICYIPDNFGVLAVVKTSLYLGRDPITRLATYEKSYRLELIRRPKYNRTANKITQEDLVELYRLENIRKKRYLKKQLQNEGLIYQYERDRWS